MKLSIAICTHNEGKYLVDLLNKLMIVVKRHPEIEIVILDDMSTDPLTQMTLKQCQIQYTDYIRVYSKKFEGDFSQHKNYLNSLCKGEYILNLDADEWLEFILLDNLLDILNANSTMDVFWFPRINVVWGVTTEYAKSRGWSITSLSDLFEIEIPLEDLKFDISFLNEHNLIINQTNTTIDYKIPIIAFPDWQCRLYRNSPHIKWVNKVHEIISGYTTMSKFPKELLYCIHHYKTVERQKQQNQLYDTMTREIK